MPRGVYARGKKEMASKERLGKEIYLLCKKIRKELDKDPGITDLKIYTHLLLKELNYD